MYAEAKGAVAIRTPSKLHLVWPVELLWIARCKAHRQRQIVALFNVNARNINVACRAPTRCHDIVDPEQFFDGVWDQSRLLP